MRMRLEREAPIRSLDKVCPADAPDLCGQADGMIDMFDDGIANGCRKRAIRERQALAIGDDNTEGRQALPGPSRRGVIDVHEHDLVPPRKHRGKETRRAAAEIEDRACLSIELQNVVQMAIPPCSRAPPERGKHVANHWAFLAGRNACPQRVGRVPPKKMAMIADG